MAPYKNGQFYIDDKYIHIFANKFSAYAIAYSTSGGSSSGGGHSSGGSSTNSAISVGSEKNGSVNLNPRPASEGTVVTITVTASTTCTRA